MSIVPFFYQHFHDLAGKLAAAGKMHVFAAGSSIPKPIWSDQPMSVPMENPMTLSGNGVAPQWFVGEGLVDIKVYTSTGSLIYTALNVSGTAASGQVPWPAASTGYLYFDEVSGVYSWRDAPGDHKVMVRAEDTPTYLDQKLLGNGYLQWESVELDEGVWGLRAVLNTAALPGVETLELLPPSHMTVDDLTVDPKHLRLLLRWNGSASDLVKTDGNSIAKSSLEPALGNPLVNDMVLASTAGGQRYWRKMLESIGLSLGPAMDGIADVTNSPITESGNIGLELAYQPSGKALMSPVSGAGKPSFRTVEFPRLQYAASNPASLYPNVGDQFMVGSGDVWPVGDWDGHRGEVAEWTGTAWEFTAVHGTTTLVTRSNQVYHQRYGGWYFYWTYGDNFGTPYMNFNSVPLYCSEVRDYSGSVRWTLNEYGLEIRTGLTGTNFLSASINISGHGNFSSVRTGTPSYPSVWTERINALGAGFLTALSISGLTNGAIPLVSTAGGLLGNSSLSEDATSVKSAKPLTLNAATRPSWDAGTGATMLSDDTALMAVYGAAGGSWALTSNAVYSGGAYKVIGTYNLGTSQPRLFQMSTDGTLRYFVDNTGAPMAGATASFTNVWSLDRFGKMTANAISISTPVTREAIIQPLPITNSAPGTVTVVSGGMKSFGFDGNASTEELFYHCDVQHDYIAGGDMVFHVHWMPATATGGNVKWQIEYQWVEGGATWPAPTTLTGTDAAGATAWADKMSSITLPGAGHTYNSRIMVRLFRVPTDAADTYAGDAVLSSVGMHYQADPGQP